MKIIPVIYVLVLVSLIPLHAQTESTIAVRMDNLSETLELHYGSWKEDKVLTSISWDSKTYVFKWKDAAVKHDSARVSDIDSITTTATSFVKSKLPDSMSPNHWYVLSCGQYSYGLTPGSEKIWIVEYQRIDGGPHSGPHSGLRVYPETLLIPIDAYGNLLVELEVHEGRDWGSDAAPNVGK